MVREEEEVVVVFIFTKDVVVWGVWRLVCLSVCHGLEDHVLDL